MATDMAEIDREIERIREFKSSDVKEVDTEEVDAKEIEINQFYKDFTARCSKLTDTNKSQLDVLYNKCPNNVILTTLDKVLEDKSLLEDVKIYFET